MLRRPLLGLCALAASCGGSSETVNRAPLAFAGFDARAEVGGTVRFDGSASSDPDGDALTYRWGLVVAPRETEAELTVLGATAAQVTGPLVELGPLDVPGIFVIGLRVDDGRLSSAPDLVTLVVRPRGAPATPRPTFVPPDAVVVVATGAEADSVTLDAGEALAAAGPGSSVAWSLGPTLGAAGMEAGASGVTLTEEAGGVARLTLPRAALGLHVVQCVLTRAGVESLPGFVHVDYVRPGEAPPLVSRAVTQFVNAGGGQVLLDGAASGPGAAAWRWSIALAPAGSALTDAAVFADPVQPARASFAPDVDGMWLVRLEAQDSAGHGGVPDLVAVEVLR